MLCSKGLRYGMAVAIVLSFAGRPAGAADPGTIVETAVSAESFKTLVTAVTAAGLADALSGEGPFTVFAPTDEAFAKLPEGTVEHLLQEENLDTLKAILLYHVVPGRVTAEQVTGLSGAVTLNGQRIDISTEDGVQIDSAKVVQADILCRNGVIHVIDSVILPASDSIPTVATNAGVFSTLLAAVEAAELAEALSGEEPLTVFAPTDDAFAKLPEGTIAALLRPENKDQLIEILKYHVLSGRVYSDVVADGLQATTLQGSQVTFTVRDGQPRIDGAAIIKTDIDASNGVIHVIDSVILPSAAN